MQNNAAQLLSMDTETTENGLYKMHLWKYDALKKHYIK